jgi:hypothetical protein
MSEFEQDEHGMDHHFIVAQAHLPLHPTVPLILSVLLKFTRKIQFKFNSEEPVFTK